MNTLIETLGWTLLHFLWQGTLAAILLWSALRALRSASASWRYALAGFTLIAMLAAATATGFRQWQSALQQAVIALPLESAPSQSSPVKAPAKGPAPAESPTPGNIAEAPVNSTGASKAATVPPAIPDLRATLRPWMPWVVAFWVGGVAMLSIRILRSWCALRRLRSRATASNDEASNTIFARLLDKMGFRKPLALLTTAEAAVPMVVGWLKPVIIVPATLFVRLPPWQVEAILAHELAHVRRHDYLVNLLQNIVETLFFYHPAVWWVSGQLRKEREHCCDDAAAATCGGALDYARALTALEELRGQVPAGALSAAGGSLLGRIRRLLGVPARDPVSVFSWPVGAAVALLVGALLVSVHLVQGEDQNDTDKLPDAPKQEMATALLKRWQQLEETKTPLPESRVAGLRKIIADFIENEPTTAKERATLTRYQNWHADRAEHEAADLTRLLNAVAAERPDLIQLAFNHEPWRGRIVDQDASKFGPAASNGLRAAWIFDPMQDTYRVGDVLKCRIIFLNSGDKPVEFATDQWHQEDKWHVTDPHGKEIATRSTWFTGVTPYQSYKLAPGEACEVAGHGVGIGVAEFAEATSQASMGQQILAAPGDEVHCRWEVSLHDEDSLTTGEVTFKVLEALPLGERPPGVVKGNGGFDLALGVHLNVTTIGSAEGYEKLAWITWQKQAGAAGDGKANIVLPQSDDPKDYSVPTFIWPRGGSALWIIQPDKLRKIDFSNVGKLTETNWEWDAAPADLGGAREDVREAIERERPAREEQSYLDRPLSEWDKLLADAYPSNRETLKSLGYGTADVTIPDAAIPMLLALVESGSPATKCRGMGTLKKLENPGDAVLDTLIRALGDQTSPGNRGRAGYVLGKFKKRADYTVPRLIPLLQREGTAEQQAAAFALGQIGPAAKDALPALEAMRGGASETLMQVIDTSIKSIRDTAPQPGAAAQKDGLLILATDTETNAPIEVFRILAGVPSSVSRGFEAAHDTTIINWQSHTIKLGKDGEFTWPADKGYAEMSLRIEADGYVPQVLHGLSKGVHEIYNLKLQRDPGITGSVQTPGGKRAAHDATVVLAMIRRDARLKGSTFPELALREGDSLRDQWDRPTVVQPDEKGRFTLPDEPDPTAVVLILHNDGVFVQPFAEWKKAPDVTLEPWGRVHGRIQFGEKPGAGEKVDLIVNRGDAYGYPDIIAQYDSTKADDNGQFVFERVLPGLVQLSSPIEVEQDTGGMASINLQGRTVHVDISAAHTPILIGGRGRPLKGKLVGRDHWEGVTFRLHPTAPHFGRPGDDTMWKAWNALKSGPLGPVFFRDDLKVETDGTFEIPAVLPGSYQIFFTREGDKGHLANSEFSVPAEDRDQAPEAMDLGEIKARAE